MRDRRGARRSALVFVDEAYADFAGDDARRRPGRRGAAERRRRPHVREGLRAGRPARGRARRRRRRRSSRCARVVPPLQHQRLRRRRRCRRRSPTRTTTSGTWRRCAQSKALLYDGARPARRPLLAERRRTSCWRDFGRRAHRPSSPAWRRAACYVRDRSRDPACAGCIRITTGVVEHTRALHRTRSRRSCAARRNRPADHGDVDRARARRSTAAAATTSAPASASSITCSSCSRATARFDLTLRARRATSTSTSTTPSRTSASRSARPSSAALGTRRGINRAGYFVMPMDETLARRRDRSRRPRRTPSSISRLKVRRVGDLQTELVTTSSRASRSGARANVHVKVLYGRSSHHQVEAVFKAFARALRVACAKDRAAGADAAEHEGAAVIALDRLRRRQPDVGAQGLGGRRAPSSSRPRRRPSSRRARGIVVPGRRPLRRDGARSTTRGATAIHGRGRRRRAAARHLPRPAVAVRGQRRSARAARASASLAGTVHAAGGTATVEGAARRLERARASAPVARCSTASPTARRCTSRTRYAAPVTAETRRRRTTHGADVRRRRRARSACSACSSIRRSPATRALRILRELRRACAI